jgi:hypothetical protein
MGDPTDFAMVPMLSSIKLLSKTYLYWIPYL